MKLVRFLLFYLLFCLGLSFSQETISFAAYQGVLLSGFNGVNDELGNIDFLLKSKMKGENKPLGYSFTSVEFEYSSIDGDFKRYAFNLGYTFKVFGEPPFEFSLSAGYGWINRWNKTMFNFNLQSELSHKIDDHLNIILLCQFIERNDLKWAYGFNRISIVGFVGIEFNI